MPKICISKLPLITTPEQFFSSKTTKIICVDVIDFTDKVAGKDFMEIIRKNDKAILRGDIVYYPIILRGGAENLILHVSEKQPMRLVYGEGFEGLYTWSGNLHHALKHKQVYNLSAYWKKDHYLEQEFEREEEFLIDRYIHQKI